MEGVFSVDVERDLRSSGTSGLENGVPRLLAMLAKHDIKATFFVTGELLAKYPKIFKKISKSGHEIALHGYTHKRFDLMHLKQKESEIMRGVRAYRKIFKKNPRGFRAPQHSIDRETIVLLEKNNFKYDSSKTPGNLMLFRHIFKKNTKIRDILSNFASKYAPYKISKNLVEMPRPAFLFSTGGFELKVYPNFTYKLIIWLCNILNIPFVFVMHSWDMIDIPSRTSKVCDSRKFEKKLDEFMRYSSEMVEYEKMEMLAK